MKTKIRRLFSALLLISVISLFNCSNSESMKKPLLKIRLTYEENIITQLFLADRASETRAVLPDLKEEYNSILWTFTLFDENDNFQQNFSFENLSTLSFFIPIDEGKWKLKVQGELRASGQNAAEDGAQENLIILEGSSGLFEISASYYFDLSIPVFLKSNSGCGKLNLKIDVSDSSVAKVILSDQSNTFNGTFYKNEEGLIEIFFSEVPSNHYRASFAFYSDSIYLFSLSQIINITNNLTSSRWTSIFQTSMNEPLFYINEDILYISTDTINQLKGNTFYVQGNDYQNLPHLNETQRNVDGSFFNPFLSIQQAIDTINIINDGETVYKIKIMGNIKNDAHLPVDAQNNSALIKISSEKDLNLEISSYFSEASIDGSFSSSNYGRIFYLGGKARLTLNNITVKGGYSSQEGGGIYMDCEKPDSEEKYNLILKGKSKLCGNHSDDSGGGIFIKEGSALFTGENVLITENNAINKGGGICLEGLSDKESRTLQINNCSITKNTALKDNGKNGSGGAIYTQFATVRISNCLIAENRAANGGGIGIAQNSNTYIENTRILNNEALHSGEKANGGGAIFASGVSANLHLLNGTYISQNKSYSSSAKAGAIKISSTKVHIYDGVYIRNNYFVISDSSTTFDTDSSNFRESNISFATGKTVTVAEQLATTNIGISVTDCSKPAEITITKNYAKYNENPVSAYFFSDDEDFYISQSNKEVLYVSRD